MIRFVDGPAAKAAPMELRRAPLLLRVVIGSDGEIDALDQLDDAPKPTEQVLVYRLTGRAGSVHLSCRPRSRSRTVITGEYRVNLEQPDEAVVRDNEQWRAWALKQPGGYAQ